MREKRTSMIELKTRFSGAKSRKRKQLNRPSGRNSGENGEMNFSLLSVITLIGPKR
jgi:hypothetical protein